MSSGSDESFSSSSSSNSSSSITPSDKQYTFTIVNGVVTAYFEVENGVTEKESIDDRDSFVIDGSRITHTRNSSDGTRTTVFSDPEGDGFYRILSVSNRDSSIDVQDDSSDVDNHKAYKFDIANGEVTAVYEREDGVFKAKPIDDAGESYKLEGNDVIRTTIKPFGTEITRFADADGDSLYFRVTEQWQVSLDAPATSTTPKITETLRYSPTSGDDFIAVRADEDCRGGQGADSFVIREAAHLRIEDFSSQEGDLLVFDTALGLTSKEHLSSFITEVSHDGQNFVVNFGPDVSITLVGVQPDQIGWDDVSVLS